MYIKAHRPNTFLSLFGIKAPQTQICEMVNIFAGNIFVNLAIFTICSRGSDLLFLQLS